MRLKPVHAAIAALAICLIFGAAFLFAGRRGDPKQDRLSDKEAAGAAAIAPQTRCASQVTYDRIKTELFREAAQIRRSDGAAYDRISAYASVRMDRPLVRGRDAELGTVRCTGYLSLDLPPGVAIAGGRRTLSAEVDYVLQPAADGSGDVVLLEGADAILIPLATLARSGEGGALPTTAAPTPQPISNAPAAEIEQNSAIPPRRTTAQAPAGREQASSSEPTRLSSTPSFNCRYAKTRSEVAVCRSSGLAALDRQMASQFYRALSSAGPRQRALLTATRTDFLRYRDHCDTDACIAETYRGRMREIRDIMADRWQPDR